MATATESRSRVLHRPNRQLMELRINEGLSPNDLGYRAGVSGKTVRLAEKGYIPSPRVQLALALVFAKQPTDIWPLQTQVRR